MIETLLFYCFAGLILISAVLTVTSRNLFRCALYLAACLFGVAAVYVVLNAFFLAAVQVLIYIGAVVVLTIFVINLTKGITGKNMSLVSRQVLPAGLICLLTAALIGLALMKSGIWGPQAVPGAAGNEAALMGKLLLGDFVVAFEAVSVLLLAALIGAIAIVTRDKAEEA